jgi:UDP-N-acetyl-D-mannosaminuronic acid dehydrogenase
MVSNSPVVCIHGLGYIGLPTAAVLANTGYDVRGYDVDPSYRRELKRGEVDMQETDLVRFIQTALDDGLSIVDKVPPADFHLICVPTPYNKSEDETDFTYVDSAAATVSEVLREGDAVILESTVPPRTTIDHLRGILEESGLITGEDFLLGYSPETILPGNTLQEIQNNDRIVGVVGDQPPDRIVALYDSFVSGEIKTTDATTAEFVKLIQNAHRDVNIAYANEVAKLAYEFGIGSRAAISLANDHPRVDILRPGPGVGGHCLPIDPLFLNYGNDIPRLINAARQINDGMVEFVSELLSAAIGNIKESTIALLGLAYKGGVGDVRESPALSLVETLERRGVGEIHATDPYVNQKKLDIEVQSLKSALQGADAAIIVTDHPEYGALSPGLLAKQMANEVIVDSRTVLDRTRWEQAGFDIYQV